jgi:hypothetical protein
MFHDIFIMEHWNTPTLHPPRLIANIADFESIQLPCLADPVVHHCYAGSVSRMCFVVLLNNLGITTRHYKRVADQDNS